MNAHDQRVAGNIYDKFGTKNIIAKQMIAGYFRQLDHFIHSLQPKVLLEVGCGEGFVLQQLSKHDSLRVMHAVDISHEILLQARDRYAHGNYACASAYSLPYEAKGYELVLCVEVLEHLESPETALREIQRVASRFVLISVPLEPTWRVLNFLRGAYVRRWGNTPGHVQHWNKRTFISLLERHFNVLNVKIQFPWIMVLCEVRQDSPSNE